MSSKSAAETSPKSTTKSTAKSTASRNAVITGSGLSLLLVLSHSANDAFANILSVLLPTLQARFTLSETVLASFVAVLSISSNVLQPVMGALSDRWGKRRLAGVGLIAGSFLMSLLAVAPSVWMLVLLLAIGGLGSAAFHPAASSMVRSASRREGLSVGIFTAGGPFGSAVCARCRAGGYRQLRHGRGALSGDSRRLARASVCFSLRLHKRGHRVTAAPSSST